MINREISDWKQSSPTKVLFKSLKEAEQLIQAELIGFSPEIKELSNKYFYLQGKLHGIKLVLEADLDEEIEYEDTIRNTQSNR